MQFEDDFGEACLKNLVLAPTTLIASARDRLLPSLDELHRLQRLLPNVQHVEVLPSAPTCGPAGFSRPTSELDIPGEVSASVVNATHRRQERFGRAERRGNRSDRRRHVR